MSVSGPQPLFFKQVVFAGDTIVEEYSTHEEKQQGALNTITPFATVPSSEEEMKDIHEGKKS
ncbi:MAG: hypothetical protein ONB14_12700 [candidate division KSB1 bacterium]|nr:hypothetical protein [candidate division KSB1 bacterium]